MRGFVDQRPRGPPRRSDPTRVSTPTGHAQPARADDVPAQEVQSVPELTGISFCQEGYRCRYSAFDISAQTYAGDPRYPGVAAHYYTPYTTMRKGASC